MTAEELVVRALLAAMEVALHFLGPDRTRDHVGKKIDEWELARLPRDTAFRAKFGEDP